MDLLDALTSGKRSSLHHWSGRRFERVPWDEVARDARRSAAGLRQAGVTPGTRVATVLSNSREAVSGLLGIWLAGGVVASLPVPARAMSLDAYVTQLGEFCRQLESPLLALDERVLRALPAEFIQSTGARAWEDLQLEAAVDEQPPTGEAVAFIQFSSGSTSVAKGCMLSARAIGNQLDTLATMVDAVPGAETVASWVPLSHDMGAFGCLLFAWAWDFDLLLSSPERFMHDPRTWFADCADFGATLSAGTPSALQVAARAQRTAPLSRDLKLRACVIGAERIAYSTLTAASEAFAPYGLVPSVWQPSYGLAEATLVVTAPALSDEPSGLWVDSAGLSDGKVEFVPDDDPGGTLVVAVGSSCAGVDVSLEEPGSLSEIRVRSSSLFSGYFAQPELTAQRLRDGELRTGDLGFEAGGQLFVVGRSDDLLTVAGRNVYAREIEAAVDLLEPVRSGCSTIVDIGSGSRGQFVMLIELKNEQADYAGLAKEASRVAKTKAGVLLDECLFLAKGTLPKTPSGKIQRFRCRHLITSESFEPVARVELRRRNGARRTGAAASR